MRTEDDYAPPRTSFSGQPVDRHQTMSSVHHGHARRDSTASAGSTDENNIPYQPMHAVSESPVAMRFSDKNGLAPNGVDADAVSVHSGVTDATGGSNKKKKTWGKASNPKSMGLAGAIAASGLAMANPLVSQQRLPPGPPSNSTAVASPQSRGAASSSQVHLSSSHAQSKNSLPRSQRSPSPQRRSRTVHEADEGVDSPVSDDEDDSGSEELDLDDDDIPVTGFAVASYKRNMDFHTLFPAVPEGDYLIEGSTASLLFIRRY